MKSCDPRSRPSGPRHAGLRLVRVSGDSLIGQRWRAGRTPSDWDGMRASTVALPITSVSKVEERRSNAPKTALAVALATGVVAIFLVFGWNSSGGVGPFF